MNPVPFDTQVLASTLASGRVAGGWAGTSSYIVDTPEGRGCDIDYTGKTVFGPAPWIQADVDGYQVSALEAPGLYVGVKLRRKYSGTYTQNFGSGGTAYTITTDWSYDSTFTLPRVRLSKYLSGSGGPFWSYNDISFPSSQPAASAECMMMLQHFSQVVVPTDPSMSNYDYFNYYDPRNARLQVIANLYDTITIGTTTRTGYLPSGPTNITTSIDFTGLSWEPATGASLPEDAVSPTTDPGGWHDGDDHYTLGLECSRPSFSGSDFGPSTSTLNPSSRDARGVVAQGETTGSGTLKAEWWIEYY